MEAPFDLAKRRSRFDSLIVARSRRFRLLLPATVEAQADVRAGDIVHIGVAPRQADDEVS
ncbi:hypothetical protein EAH75_16210 [Rhodanobacter glycinis]|nr:hypothetical protein EAH75_16210 [Rhodanobacter glycinis]